MPNGLSAYRSYKDSGLPWLGQIPSQWEVRRNGRLFEQRKQTGHGELPILEVSLKTGVRVRDMDAGRKQVMSNREAYKKAAKGDIAYNMMRMWQGAVGVAPADGLVSPAYVVARPLPGVEPRYFSYLFRTAAYMDEVDKFSRGIVKDRNRLYWDQFKQMPSAFPELLEQTQIADFLDRNAAQVSRFVRNKRRAIELLNEQRQAIVTNAITRGLDPSSKLRPSGISLLGDIPEHWTLKRLKTVVRFTSGQVDPRILPYRDYVLIAPDHIQKHSGRIIRFETAHAQGAISGKYIVQPGDVIYSKIRPALRKAALSPELCLCSADMYPLSPAGNELLPDYLLLLLLSPPVTRYAVDCSMRVAMPKVNRDALGNCWLVFPNVAEQARILRHLETELAPLDAGVAHAEREVSLIREYRSRLIADVVTGKLDVRGAILNESVTPSLPSPVSRSDIKPTANVHFRRSVFAAEIIHRLHAEPTFGHVKFEKVMFLCEKRCGVNTGSSYHRDAAGPYDNRAIRSIDSQIKKQNWYAAQKNDKRYEYVPLAKAGGHRGYFDRYFTDVETAFSAVIDLCRTWSTQRCEILATLYSAWEDLLAAGRAASDDEIVQQVLKHWHPSKKQIEEDRWRAAIGWMRQKGFTPEVGRLGGIPPTQSGEADDVGA
jgi:type I restriction enzyme S subunit